jgi:hypothetical protein
MQVPAPQTRPGPHDTHAEPSWPQALSLVAAMQVLPLQHPLQVDALHAVPPTHAPPEQVAPDWQAPQLTPFKPQLVVVCDEGGRHVPPEQQPAQLKKSHPVTAVHAPLLHESPVPHALQAAPALPHRPVD